MKVWKLGRREEFEGITLGTGCKRTAMYNPTINQNIAK
jgi:hypothetical protein